DQTEYVKVLIDAGHMGRTLRGIVGSTTPIRDLRISSISDFSISYVDRCYGLDVDGSGRGYTHLGKNMFAAFAESARFTVYDPQLELGTVPGTDRLVGYSRYARQNFGKIEPVKEHYYLSEQRDTDVVIAGETCRCHYDTHFMDYMKSVYDLIRKDSLMLMICEYAAGQKPFEALAKMPFFNWMSRAGFAPYAFVSFDNIGELMRNELCDIEESRGAAGYPEFPLKSREIPNLDKINPEKLQRWESSMFLLRGGEIFSLNSSEVKDGSVLFPYWKQVLAFQRTRFPMVEEMSLVMKEAITWEREHQNDSRGLYYDVDREAAAGRFEEFCKFKLPELMARYEAAIR
ncbi:MAG: hypothetical protein WC500_02600, partial [Candidatus Margulisiibacteriota bacterium]